MCDEEGLGLTVNGVTLETKLSKISCLFEQNYQFPLLNIGKIDLENFLTFCTDGNILQSYLF